MIFADKFYNLVLYDRTVKRLVGYFLQNKLITQNYFYQKKYNKLLKRKMAQYEKVPFRLMVENTNACNSNCSFCPHNLMERPVGYMSIDLFKKVIDQSVAFGINYVTIYGFGEPLLDPYFIERVKYAKTKGIKRVTTNTNASLLNYDMVKKIIESGLDEIYISFDAATAETYQKIRPNLIFNIVEKNIKRLMQLRDEMKVNKPEVILSFVEAQENKHEVKKYIQKWKNIVDHISISLIHNWTGNLAEKLAIRNNGQFRDPCRLLWTDMVVSWNGLVPRCCNDYDNKIILGDLNKQTIVEIWGGEELRKKRNNHRQRNFINCADCTYNLHHKSPWWVSK